MQDNNKDTADSPTSRQQKRNKFFSARLFSSTALTAPSTLKGEIEEKEEESISPTSPSSPSLIRKLSKILSTKIIEDFNEECTGDMLRVEKALERQDFYQIMMNTVPRETENLIRFLSSIEEWRRIKLKLEKKQKAQKMLRSFVRAGGKYQITSFPDPLLKTLLNKEFDEFLAQQARYFALEILAKDSIVMSTLEFEALNHHQPDDDFFETRSDSSLASDQDRGFYSKDLKIRVLERVIYSQDNRSDLINHLLTTTGTGQLCAKVRFVSTVEQYENCEDPLEKKKMAQKISFIFVRHNAMFKISSIPEHLRKSILNGRFKSLSILKKAILRELSENEDVIRAVELLEY